nr:translational initiation factor 1 [Neustanthus phaseoloides]WCI20957.1 translational initiation factor 1 [Neustanthus phaseoloides]
MLIIGYVSKKIQRTFYGYTIRKEKIISHSI